MESILGVANIVYMCELNLFNRLQICILLLLLKTLASNSALGTEKCACC